MFVCVVLVAGVLSYCIAPTYRHVMCAQLIMASDVDVNSCDIYGIPLLLRACETAHENEQICLMMLQKGADLTKKDEAGLLTIDLLQIRGRFEKLSVMQYPSSDSQ